MTKVEKFLKIFSFVSILLAVLFSILNGILESKLGGNALNKNASNSSFKYAVAKAGKNSIPIEVSKGEWILSNIVTYAMVATLFLALFCGLYLMIRYVCIPEFGRYKKYFKNMFKLK